MMLDWQCISWKNKLEEDVNDYMNIESYLVQLQQPYEFLNFRQERERKIGMSFDEIGAEQEAKNEFKK